MDRDYVELYLIDELFIFMKFYMFTSTINETNFIKYCNYATNIHAT